MPEQVAGRFGPVQLVAVELAAIAVGAAVFLGPPVAGRPVAGVLAGAAAVLLGGTLVRSGGRWGYEAAAARQRLRHRRRANLRALREPGVLAGLAPDLAIRAVTDRGTAIGVGQDGLGWFVAMAVSARDGAPDHHPVALRVDWLARLLTEFSVPVSTLQVVAHQVPLAGRLAEQTACALSYRELLGVAPAPVHQELWLAARLGPRDGAGAAAGRGAGLTGVHRALTAVLARAGSALAAADLDHRVLDADGLRRALTVACGLERPGQTSERWAGWHATGAVHVGFAVRAWPADPGSGLLAELARVPAATAVHTAVVLRPSPDGSGDRATVRALLRVAATPDLIATSVQQVHASARRLGVRLTRLNGEHAAAVYATAPTGAVHGIVPW